ncbi:pyridoxamine 5'-phosphate oxidase family protein [Actinoplanes sp. URMC 104]|uniref:pyridoxamine 5'-phosphate oxidase family protein n=1 Tax=Actinoplanes sp. URMC 104 TaxID=3423409 RepID=UPI003F1D0231
MTRTPEARRIPRRGRTKPPGYDGSLPLADWTQVCARLRGGEVGPFWLGVAARDGAAPHVRPIFAAWAESSFFFVSKEGAAKTRHLARHPAAAISADLGPLHLVVEGRSGRVTTPERLALASRTLHEVFGWPTVVAGDQLDADGGAPTSGGPPYQVFELVPARAYGFPTDDQLDPTRWTFDPAPARDR